MGRNPFQVLGPFEINGAKTADKEYLKTFWAECDEEFAQLSEANGLYLFSLCIGSNYDPHYVGITKRQFNKEVFNPSNVVKILNTLVPSFAKVKPPAQPIIRPAASATPVAPTTPPTPPIPQPTAPATNAAPQPAQLGK